MIQLRRPELDFEQSPTISRNASGSRQSRKGLFAIARAVLKSKLLLPVLPDLTRGHAPAPARHPEALPEEEHVACCAGLLPFKLVSENEPIEFRNTPSRMCKARLPCFLAGRINQRQNKYLQAYKINRLKHA